MAEKDSQRKTYVNHSEISQTSWIFAAKRQVAFTGNAHGLLVVGESQRIGLCIDKHWGVGGPASKL